MIFGNELLSFFAVSHLRVSAFYTLLKYLRYRETSSSNQGRRNGGAWRRGATGAQVSLHNNIIGNFRNTGERWNDGFLPFWKRGNRGGGAFS